jgi:hypothetical protein
MIDATQLRIGNWLLDEFGNPDTVTSDWFGAFNMGFSNVIDNQFIPLTSEILEKAGFQYRGDTTPKRWNKPMSGFHSTWSLYEFDGNICFSPYEWNYTLKLKYVHQLQNLFFALTCEELTIDLSIKY